MKILACSKCGSTESVRLNVIIKKKGIFGLRFVKTSYVTDRCFNCKCLLAGNNFWADENLVRKDRTVLVN